MTALKSALFGIALGLVSALTANAADLAAPVDAPVYIRSPPPFTWSGA